jgi:F-type H+-transporting ATPase subunit epsilon
MAEQKTFHLTVARVDGPLYDADAVSVQVPGIAGDMTILADHEPLISPIRRGVISIKRGDNSEESFECEKGTLEVAGNRVSVLL